MLLKNLPHLQANNDGVGTTVTLGSFETWAIFTEGVEGGVAIATGGVETFGKGLMKDSADNGIEGEGVVTGKIFDTRDVVESSIGLHPFWKTFSP